jgi:SelR domain
MQKTVNQIYSVVLGNIPASKLLRSFARSRGNALNKSKLRDVEKKTEVSTE